MDLISLFTLCGVTQGGTSGVVYLHVPHQHQEKAPVSPRAALPVCPVPPGEGGSRDGRAGLGLGSACAGLVV